MIFRRACSQPTMKPNYIRSIDSLASSVSFFTVMRCLLAVVGLVLLAQTLFFLPTTIRRHYSNEWPTVPGVIRAVGLKLHHQQSDRPSTFTPTVVYSYEVNGVPRTSTQINFANGSPIFLEKQGVAWLEQGYAVGKPVTVHYDPRDPDTAVLMPGAPELLIRGWCVPLTAACFFFSVLLSPRLEKRRTTQNLTGEAGSNGPAIPLPILALGEPATKAA